MNGTTAVTIDQIDQTHTAALLVDELGYERAADLAYAILDIVAPDQDEDEDDDDVFGDDEDGLYVVVIRDVAGTS